MPFSAVLLAGGASRRMGVDKALLPVPTAASPPCPLWQHQITTLLDVRPAEIMVSGPTRPGFPTALRCVPDDVPARGPLGGLATCLGRIITPRMLVLAVDLPKMTAEFLARLLEACAEGKGVVPQTSRGYEPLVAIYPRTAARIARAAVAGNRLRLQDFVMDLIVAGLVQPYLLSPDDLRLFNNWNAFRDLRPE